jgi:peptidoglycan/LPS O-acetylase OafA/YrhL
MNSLQLVHLFHIFIVGGLFLYVGINREKIYKPLFSVLFYLGLVIIFYHLYKIYGYLKANKGIWVNLIHVFIVGPLLIYIGYNGEKTTRKFFELLLMLGFASIGYHLYYLFQ